MFPREAGIAIEQYGNGMRLDIDRFDKFIGEPLIRKHYERIHKDEKQQDNVTALLKAQVEQNKMMQEAVMIQLMSQRLLMLVALNSSVIANLSNSRTL